ILLANGGGGFQPAMNLFAGAAAVVVSDFDGDGNLDVLASAGSVFFGTGTGTFSAAHYIPGASASAVALADFDGDGLADLVFPASTSGRVLLGTRQGTFQVPPFQTVGENPMSVASGDFNGDGRLDLDSVTAVITADLNGDGKLDAAVTGVTSTVNVFLGRG